MLVIDLGVYAKYLFMLLPIDNALIFFAITAFVSIILYQFFKRVPILGNVIGFLAVFMAISAILTLPLIIFFEFLELSTIKRILILMIALIIALMFSIFNSKLVIKYISESRSISKY